MHIKSDGVLLLVIPIRCIDSKFVGGLAEFEALLSGFGFGSLLPVKFTPRLAFFVLGINTTTAAAATTATATATTNNNNDIKKNNKNKSSNNNNNQDGNSISNEACSKSYWETVARDNLRRFIAPDTLRRFTDPINDSAGPNDFSLKIPSQIIP